MTRHPVRCTVVAAALVAMLPAATSAETHETPTAHHAGDILSDSGVAHVADSEATPAPLHLAVTRALARDAKPDYRIDADGHGTNPRHGLALSFTPEGALIERTQNDHERTTTCSLALRLERFGRGDGEPVHPTAPRIDGARVEYDRGAGLREWFVNLPQGIEQGWTITRRPAGDGPLMLELDTGRPPDRVDGERLAWSGLDYHGLVALDAEGRELPARWISDGARLRIEVHDTAAAYPVVIDPWLQQAKLTAGDGATGDNFGFAVDLAGDTALVGAWQANPPSNGGAAYVFTRSGDTWSEQATLIASDPEFQAQFGFSVALSSDGDTALIGAHNDGQNNQQNQGAVYVFTRDGMVWSERVKLTADDAARGAFFGESVALSGNTALVGAARADVDGNDQQGAAYVFTGSGGDWTQRAKLVADDGAPGDRFGNSVSLSGDTAVVGAHRAAVDGNDRQGAAYVFVGSGEGWSQQDKLTASDGTPQDDFGRSVAIAGDTALVGAPPANAVYPFTRSGETWSEQDKLTASDGATGDNFGRSVAVSDDAAVVGANRADIGGNANQGAAYVFIRSGEAWSEQDKLTADDGGSDELFGTAVALSGDTVVVGARFAVVDGNVNQGAAYVFLGVLAPAALEVDFAPLGSDGNGVFEPGEQVEAAPGWRNNGSDDAFADGILSNFVGPEGASYEIVLNGVGYGPIPPGQVGSCRDSGTGCYQLEILPDGADRPASHWDATVDEELQTGPDEFVTHNWTLHLGDSFEDVPRTNGFYSFIETLIHNAVTSGCTATTYCPGSPNTRAQMAVFVLKSLEGSDYSPQPCEEGSETFDDVPFDNQFCSWIEELADRDVVSGCAEGSYCPNASITRAQMAVFLLKTLEGGDYVPPECTGVFTDVTCPSTFADWIEDLATREITSGCTATEYCPGEPQTRAQMAVFLTKTFGLLLYGP